MPRAWDLFDQALRAYEGIGWYSVVLDGSWARPGKVQHLRFGRVMYDAKVWLNGELLGQHVDGYLPFEFDVTGKLKDAVNHLVLRVDNRPRIDLLPAAKQIEWVQYGGILQPVHLESTGSIFLSDLTIRAVPAGEGATVSCTAQLNARAGELVRLAMAEAAHFHDVEHLPDPTLDLIAPDAFLFQAEGDVLLHTHVRKQRIGLEHHVHRPLIRRHGAHVVSVDQDAPGASEFQIRPACAAASSCRNRTRPAGRKSRRGGYPDSHHPLPRSHRSAW